MLLDTLEEAGYGPADVDAVGGLTLGADPVATALLHAAASRGLDLDAFVVRKESKAHGLQRRIEGPDVTGRRVVAVEDTSTTGGSVLTAVEALREAGAEVVAVAVIVALVGWTQIGAPEYVPTADTQINAVPSAAQIAETVIGAVRHAKRFGVEPKVALCSHSSFGNLDSDSGRRMRDALEILDAREVDFTYEGEMNADAALDPELRARIFPGSRMQGPANVLVFAYSDAASTARNMLKLKAGGLEVGPILMGMGNRAHIATPSITARGLLNMSAIAGTPVAHYG